MFLPQKIEWVSVDTLSPSSYREILIVTHKHSVRDWHIIHGWIEPIEQYSDFKIMAKPNGLGSHYPDVEIPKSEIISVGIFRQYGTITDGEA